MELLIKNSLCPTDGLNQKFKIIKSEYGRKQAIADDITKDDLANKLICKINVDDICKKIYDENINEDYSFDKYVNKLFLQKLTVNQAAILVDGTVVPCCLDGNGILNLGNINLISFSEIIESKRSNNIIDGFSRREAVEELCRKCGYRQKFGK